jgi:hypothetical protein
MSDQQTAAPAPGTPEYDAKMIALAESSGSEIRVNGSVLEDKAPESAPAPAPASTDTTKAQRPEGVPEKFWNAETGQINTDALLKSYTELERARSAPKTEPAKEPAKVEPTADQKAAQAELDAATTDEAKAAATAKLTAANAAADAAKKTEEIAPTAALQSAMELAADAFAKNGEISEEAFVALEKSGITREYATQYAIGLKAQAELVEVKMYAEVGGREQYQAMHAWAAQNLSQEQKVAFNSQINTTLESAIGAARNLKMIYEAANGRSPTGRVEPKGGSNEATPVEMFRSEAEVTKAMSDPRYSSDAAFRKDVEAKLLASMNAGLNVLR